VDIFEVARAMAGNERARLAGGIDADMLGRYPRQCWQTVKMPPRSRTAVTPRRKRMDWGTLIAGVFIGTMFGFFIAALLAAAGRDSE